MSPEHQFPVTPPKKLFQRSDYDRGATNNSSNNDGNYVRVIVIVMVIVIVIVTT